MGKLSDADFADMSSRLRTRASRLIRQLDAGSGYRAQVEQELEKRMARGSVGATARSATAPAERPGSAKASPSDDAARECACGTVNDADAKFCKSCGAKLEAR